MSAPNLGGFALIGLIIFGLGAGCNETWGDTEHVTHTDVKVIKVPDTRVQTEVIEKEVRVPLPGACDKTIDLFTKIRGLDNETQESTGTLLMDVKEAHTLLATGRARELVPVIEAIQADVSKAGDNGIAREKLLIQFDELLSECRDKLGED